jgi:hypothetical protein
MLEKDKFLEKTSYLLFVFTFCFCGLSSAKDIKLEIDNYNKTLSNSSAKFIQSDGETIEEGILYIGSDRIKIDYNSPEITIVLSKKKGMYTNHGLKETQFFNTNKSLTKFFFDILTGQNNFNNSDAEVSKKTITIKNIFKFNESLYKTEIIYENNPISLKKIKLSKNNEKIEVGIFNITKSEKYNKDFFLLIDPYLN